MSNEISAVEAANLETGNVGGVDPLAGASGAASQNPVEAVEQMYDVKVNGQTIKVPLKELTAGYSRQRDYTEKTTRLAQEREGYERQVSEYKGQLEQVSRFLSDPRVQSALRNLQAGITDPSQPPTAEQLAQLQRMEAQRQEAMLNERMSQMSQELEVRTLAAHYSTEIDSTLKGLLDKHDVLKDIDGIEDLLRKDVASREPATLQEAKQLFAEAAQMRADRIMTRFQSQQKQAAVQQAQLAKTGIEVGGQAPAIVPPEKKFKLGTPDLFQAAVSDLMQTALNK